MRSTFRVVPDTNVVIAAQNNNPQSPNREIFEHWRQGNLQFLYSFDTLEEYFEKLEFVGVPQEIIEDLLADLMEIAEHVPIQTFHFRTSQYPTDPDDIAFILCAHNGDASHIVTYDNHLLDVAHQHKFRICKPVPFLQELRKALKG